MSDQFIAPILDADGSNALDVALAISFMLRPANGSMEDLDVRLRFGEASGESRSYRFTRDGLAEEVLA